jgi:hypothetical protein
MYEKVAGGGSSAPFVTLQFRHRRLSDPPETPDMTIPDCTANGVGTTTTSVALSPGRRRRSR